jgi:predicted unusual protein kinase regulating ubiquinone biosynthesis (AarF/ABC1/UbiB family)
VSDHSALQGFLSKYEPPGSDASKSSIIGYDKFIIPRKTFTSHVNGNDGEIAGQSIGTSPLTIVDDQPILHPTSQVRDSMAYTPWINAKDIDPPKIAEKEVEQVVQKIVNDSDSYKTISLSAIGIGLLSLVLMIGVRLRRGVQPATALTSSSGPGLDMPINTVSALGDNIMEMKSEGSNINHSAAVLETTPSSKVNSGRIGWGQLSSQRSDSLTPCYATSADDTNPPPLLKIPIPGSSTATLELPAFETQLNIARQLRDDVRDVDPRAAIERSLKATRAVRKITTKALLDPSSRSAPRVTRELFEELGATFVKLGQLIASSPTLFPEEWTTEFEKCLDGAPPIPFSVVKETVERSLGKQISAAFATFDSTPLATASVAQVHAATLQGSNERVVVKVIKPGVENSLIADLALMNGAARILEAIAPEMKRVSLLSVAEELRDGTKRELDLRKEAESLVSFDAFLQRAGFADKVCVPKPYVDLSSREVLTMSRLDGNRLTDATASEEAAQSVATVIQCWSKSVVEHEFFHADLHGGNVLLLEDGRVGLIDFGIVGTLPENVYGAVISLAAAFNAQPERDYPGVARALKDMGVVDGGAAFNEAQFAAELKKAIEATEANDAAAIVSDVIAVSENNNLVLPSEFGLLTKQAIYLNRYVTTLAPDLNPFAEDMLGSAPPADVQNNVAQLPIDGAVLDSVAPVDAPVDVAV